MRIFWAAAAAAILVCGAASAEGPMPSPANGDAAVGVGVICNTSEEARQFVDLRSHGAAPDQAVQAVNANAMDERACGVAAIAYVHDGTVDTSSKTSSCKSCASTWLPASTAPPGSACPAWCNTRCLKAAVSRSECRAHQ